MWVIGHAPLFFLRILLRLWLGKTDDLWSWGKPQGWGSVWSNEPVAPKGASDPYIMTGFDKKVVHVSMEDPGHTGVVTIHIELDTLGTAVQTGRWRTLARLNLTADNGYFIPYVFATGMSAHWVRVSSPTGCPNCTATFIYT